ncbi:MAG: efflux RND transporter permease subunit [Rickettsiaceae bacterium]|nr:efflux RND transporter permease subunit [Rickettsiaceae bacterium]
MILAEISIKKPVLAIVLNLILILLGIVCFGRLAVRDTPDISLPVITITSLYDGASPEFVEKNITSVIESKVKTAKKIDHISSTSSSGKSEITIFFKLNADVDIALNDVRSKVADCAIFLPSDMTPPQVSKMDMDSNPSIWINASGPKYDPLVLSDIITQRAIPELERIEGVSACKLYSSHKYAILVKLDPLKLLQYKLSPIEIRSAILSQSKDFPSGVISTKTKDYVILLEGELNSPEEFGDVIIDQKNLLKLKDIAKIERTSREQNNSLRFNGTEAVTLGILKTSKANLVKLSDEIMRTIPKIERSLPDGIKLKISYDSALSVKESIDEVYITILIALILVIVIVYLFLGSIEATIIPLTAIPISLIGTFAFMYFCNFTINLFSLLAIIMTIGLVVDDAIVMVENIYTHIEKGVKPLEAAFMASRQIGYVIVTMTFTLSAVFLPIGLIEGFVGKLLIEFAWTLAFCIIISGIVSLTLSPMLGSRMLKPYNLNSRSFIIKLFSDFLDKTQALYISSLEKGLKHPKVIYLSSLISIFVLILGVYFARKEFVPNEDISLIILSGTGADGITTEKTVEYIKEVEQFIASIPETNGFFASITGSDLFGIVPLKSWSKRTRSQQDIVKYMRPFLEKIPSITIYPFNPGPMKGAFDKPVMFNLMSFEGFDRIDDLSKKFVIMMQESKIFRGVQRDFKDSIPTLSIDVNREKAAKYGISIDQVGATMQNLIAGVRLTQFNMGNEQYDVIMQLDKKDRMNVSDLTKIYVKSNNGTMINLSSIASIKETSSVASFSHYNNIKSIKIVADLNDGYSISDALKSIEAICSKIMDKSKISIEYLGDIKNMNEANSEVLFTFVLAILFIYLALCAQFESFYDPLIILLSVPFAITGGVVLILISGSSLNLYSNIGIITLIGLITKNAVMIVEFANQLKNSGANKFEAIIEASKQRLRPILMTSVATIAGCLPLALATGASAASRSSIGIVIVGGMSFGTLFTLFVIPFLYYKFKR